MADPKDKAKEPAPAPVKKEKAKDNPIDPSTGKPYKSGEIPPGCNEPLP